jgi:hypothetical protein
MDKVNIYVVGERYQVPAVGNYDLMNSWYQANVKALASAGLMDSINVSSWSLVIDIWWKRDFASVRMDDVQPKAAAPYTY